MAPDPQVSRFPPIHQYGMLGDCHTGALVAPDGSVEWLCLPRFDSPSVFGALLDRSAGFWHFGPSAHDSPASRRYIPGTNVLESTWLCDGGWVIVREALTVGEWRPDPKEPHKRPPTDHEAEHQLVRVAECVHGEVDVEMTCMPDFEYGSERAPWEQQNDEATRASATHGDLTLHLGGDLRMGLDGAIARARHRLKAGESCFTAISWRSEPVLPTDVEGANSHLKATYEFWREWLSSGHFPDHPWASYLQRSALVLKALTYVPTGATVAALTTSLPETPGGERNWDYRYTWIRDATFTLWAMHTLGFDWEAFDFMEFIADICRSEGPGLQIMYGIDGEKELTEKELDLHGYDGARPVRIGNAAYEQRQNDVYGALLDSVYIHTKARDHLPDELWRILTEQVESAIKVWKKPDQGIWEARGEPQHYVSSKLMCWVALDRGARLAHRRDDTDQAEEWRNTAEEIRTDILENGVSDRKVFRQHYGTDALDASTLLVPLVRFLPSDDERVRNTVLAIADELTEQGLVLRYKVEETDDGLHGEEATFTICSFWLVSALSEIGERDRARHLCERLINFAGPLHLYAEELDASTGRHWGNYPQAFTHLALINAVVHVISDEESPSHDEPAGILTKMLARS